jgi:hypothetical protein
MNLFENWLLLSMRLGSVLGVVHVDIALGYLLAVPTGNIMCTRLTTAYQTGAKRS